MPSAGSAWLGTEKEYKVLIRQGEGSKVQHLPY